MAAARTSAPASSSGAAEASTPGSSREGARSPASERPRRCPRPSIVYKCGSAVRSASRNILPRSLPRANHCSLDQSDTHVFRSCAARVGPTGFWIRGTSNRMCRLPNAVTDSISIVSCAALRPHLWRAVGIFIMDAIKKLTLKLLPWEGATSSIARNCTAPSTMDWKNCRLLFTQLWRSMWSFSLLACGSSGSSSTPCAPSSAARGRAGAA
mmetsp:Transcript_16312/g.51125  ORF Transcript_16312/g.51125 Transcript_16312/m.51125 type:complete len:211 (+) Transcript_16312:294-926(+)